jgi:hypothetical protein
MNHEGSKSTRRPVILSEFARVSGSAYQTLLGNAFLRFNRHCRTPIV